YLPGSHGGNIKNMTGLMFLHHLANRPRQRVRSKNVDLHMLFQRIRVFVKEPTRNKQAHIIHKNVDYFILLFYPAYHISYLLRIRNITFASIYPSVWIYISNFLYQSIQIVSLPRANYYIIPFFSQSQRDCSTHSFCCASNQCCFHNFSIQFSALKIKITNFKTLYLRQYIVIYVFYLLRQIPNSSKKGF